MKQVAIFGGVSLDRTIYLDTTELPPAGTVFSRGARDQVGSTGAGKALNLARLGFAVYLHAQVGVDPAGRHIRDYFDRQPIETVFYDDPEGTETHVNLMDREGRRISIFTSSTTFDPMIAPTAFAEIIQRADYVVLNIMNYVRRLIPVARAAGKKIWCDVHDYDGQSAYHQDFVAAADYLFCSADRLADPDAFMRQQIAGGKELVVCTRGRHGASALDSAGNTVEAGIVEGYGFIDANGAGDAFFAGFLYGHDKGADLATCMKYAAIAGGLCVASPELYNESLTPAVIEAEFSQRMLRTGEDARRNP